MKMSKTQGDKMPREEVEALIATYKKYKFDLEINLWRTINMEMKEKGFRKGKNSMNMYKNKWISMVKKYEEKQSEEGITHWQHKAMADVIGDTFVPFKPEADSQNSEIN